MNFKDCLIEEMKENFGDYLLDLAFDEMALGRHIVPDGLSDEGIIDDLFAYKPPRMRKLLQRYGTDVRRKDNPNYWVQKWENKYCAMHPADVVIDDCRFFEERDAIKRYGGILIRIVRSDITSGGTHQSETEQLQFEPDYTITVDPGDHEGLYKQLDEIV